MDEDRVSQEQSRLQMVERQIVSRGVRDQAVLRAMREVPRHHFVPGQYREFAYDDHPLPIEAGQTISQPLIVAMMIEALQLRRGARVLEIGAGSGYAAAVLSRIARSVFAVERHEELARLAQRRATSLGYDNVHVLCADGTLGWPEHAPYDAILVSAGAPDVPHALLNQLAIGGTLVLPVGKTPRSQELLRVVRLADHEFEETNLGQVQFVPLVGAQGWEADVPELPPAAERRPLRRPPTGRVRTLDLVRRAAEPFDAIEDVDLARLLARIGDARVVLLGEATHGTAEFYDMRARITRALIEHAGFDIVAIEGDWPDTAVLDRHVRGLPEVPIRRAPFTDFPTWMWRNTQMERFVGWLAEHNRGRELPQRVSMHGLDLYSLNNSIGAVLHYLDGVDERAAQAARARYGCFSPWESDPAVYGRAAILREIPGCEADAVAMLQELLRERLQYASLDGDSFFDAERNATVIRDAERYYRAMYYSSRESWNLRDTHMFETLRAAMAHRGSGARAVVWAHNSHVGNAAATEVGARGEINIGQLVRETYGRHAYVIGFGTHHGTVAAASNWNEPVQFMDVRPSHEQSFERLFHDSQSARFMLPLRHPDHRDLSLELSEPRLERAIGVVYRPESELLSHYFQASLSAQFDEVVWFDRSSAVAPLDVGVAAGADTYPFAL